MEGKLIHLRIPNDIYKHLKETGKVLYFSNVQDLIREILRRYILEVQKREIIKWLAKSKGTLKEKIKKLTKKEKDELIKEYLSKSNIFGEYNL